MTKLVSKGRAKRDKKSVKKRSGQKKKQETKSTTLDSFVKKETPASTIVIDEDDDDDVFGDNSLEQLEFTAYLLGQNALAVTAERAMLKPYVGGVDIGFKKLGFCVYSLEPHINGPVFIEETSLLRTADGRIYADYKEKLNHELVYNWIADRWERFFSKMSLVTIEKQMIGSHVQWHLNGKVTKAITQKERACITIETAMKSILWTERARGGPQVYVVRAQDWKVKAGIEIGNHGAATGNLSMSRVQNKERSDAMFQRWVAKKHPAAIKVLELIGKDKPSTDMCDAFFTAYYAHSQYKKIMLRTAITSNHNFTVNGKKVAHSERVKPLPKLSM